MLLLCSDGLSSKSLRSVLAERLRNCRSAALVVTADNEYKKQNYHVPRCMDELKALGLSVALFDLDTHPCRLLNGYDVVEFIGGNPFYLLDSVRKSGAEAVLREIAADKLLIGWSAAAFVFGPSWELVSRYSPEMNFMGRTDFRGLGLTEIQVLPHNSRFCKRFKNFEETCREYERNQGINVLRLNDGDGVFIGGGAVTLFRG